MAVIPPGVRIHGTPPGLAACFGALVALQPVGWDEEGLVCAPRTGPPEEVLRALRDCPVPWSPLTTVPGWPDPPSWWMSGWYVRSPAHAAPPPGVRELIQVPGEGFGPIGHPTTAMCLTAMTRMPAGPAVDLGCGSGLLSQAWVRSGCGPVVAVDLDAAAITHARAGFAAAGVDDRVQLLRGPVGVAAPHLSGAVLLANIPAAAHAAMHACMHAQAPPAAVVCSGLRPGEGRSVARDYARLGLRITAVSRRGGWECWSLRR